MLKSCYDILDQLRLPHGLYLASSSKHYQYVWIRDSVYMAMPYLDKNDGLYEFTFYRLLDLFREYEWKLDIHTQQKPVQIWEYFHARFSAEDVQEIPEPWGHAQHDSIGAVLFGLAQGINYGKKMFRDSKDKEIVQKLVAYLNCLEYWHDPDNGMWEENREVHASSVGACVAGLKAISSVVQVPKHLIENGKKTLQKLYPHESSTKWADLAQLSMIYPYQLYHGKQAERIIAQIERKLVRKNGVIRYMGDSYYSTLERQFGRGYAPEFYYGSEAEWTFGFSWLALCYLELKNKEKAAYYLEKARGTMIEPGVFPELYYAKCNKPGPNTPLGWSSAMYILAFERYQQEYSSPEKGDQAS